MNNLIKSAGRTGNAGSIAINNVLSTPAKYIDTNISVDISQSDFSISLWVKFSRAQNYIVTQARTLSPISSNFIVLFSPSIFWFRTVTLGNIATINDNIWHHLVLIWNKSIEKYTGYVDGSSIGQSGVVSGYSSEGNILFGIRWDRLVGSTTIYNGLIDQIKIYQRQFQPNEVKLLSQGLPISRTNLLAEYNLNSTEIKDTSGNNNDGTNVGATFTTDKPF